MYYTSIIQAIKRGDLAYLQNKYKFEQHQYKFDQKYINLYIVLSIEHEQFEVYKYLYNVRGNPMTAKSFIMDELQRAIDQDLHKDFMPFILINSPFAISDILYSFGVSLKYVAYIFEHFEMAKYYASNSKILKNIFHATMWHKEYNGLEYFKTFIDKYNVDLRNVPGLDMDDLIKLTKENNSIEHEEFIRQKMDSSSESGSSRSGNTGS